MSEKLTSKHMHK